MSAVVEPEKAKEAHLRRPRHVWAVPDPPHAAPAPPAPEVDDTHLVGALRDQLVRLAEHYTEDVSRLEALLGNVQDDLDLTKRALAAAESAARLERKWADLLRVKTVRLEAKILLERALADKRLAKAGERAEEILQRAETLEAELEAERQRSGLLELALQQPWYARRRKKALIEAARRVRAVVEVSRLDHADC